MTFLWFCVSCFIYMFNRCYSDEFMQYIQFLLIYLIVISCFFSPSFCSCYYGTLKRVYETSNLSNSAFFKHFVFESNLIFNIIKLTFPCFRKFGVNPKDFTLKRHLISSAFNSYKKVLMKKFFPHIVHRIHIDPINFLKSADISNFLGLFW